MTESHLRRLAVTMRLLEDVLLEVEAALEACPHLLMTIYEDDIPRSVRPAIQEQIRHVREEIRVVKDRYGLESEAISNRRRIAAKLAILSVDLTEATSRYLRAYGEVPEEEQGALDHQINKLISLVERINSLVR
jgi:hypothetical protein